MRRFAQGLDQGRLEDGARAERQITADSRRDVRRNQSGACQICGELARALHGRAAPAARRSHRGEQGEDKGGDHRGRPVVLAAAAMARAATEPRRLIAQNRKARHNYLIERTIEAGIMLTGTEVKSLRMGRASIGESYAAEQGGGIYLLNSHIPEYPPAGKFNH